MKREREKKKLSFNLRLKIYKVHHFSLTCKQSQVIIMFHRESASQMASLISMRQFAAEHMKRTCNHHYYSHYRATT